MSGRVENISFKIINQLLFFQLFGSNFIAKFDKNKAF